MRSAAAVAALIGAVAASPAKLSDYIIRAAPTTTTPQNATGEPCALVAKALGNNTDGILDASLAYQCLQSVPLQIKNDTVLLEGVKAFTEFQSTLAYLKSPPEGYLYPGVDILAAYDEIAKKLKNGGYAGEYDFQMDISNTILSAHDGHFTYYADITQVFGFMIPLLYSVSRDGVSVPSIYLENDFFILAAGNTTTSTVSPVSQINGEDVEKWLNYYGAHNGGNGYYQDPDANYNAIFSSYAKNTSSPNQSYNYQGPVLTFKFVNGSTYVVDNKAMATADFTGVVDGESFFKKFCTFSASSLTSTSKPSSSAAANATSSTASMAVPTTEVPFKAVPTQTANPGLSGILDPATPVIISDDELIAGYFPAFNNDLAVLAVTGFEPTDATQFSNVAREFLATSQTAGKKKLIIDLRDNGGGFGYSGYDLFTQLFPTIKPYGATNFRATPLFHDTGAIVSDFYSNWTNITTPIGVPALCNSDYSNPWDYRLDLTVDDTPFSSWDEFYGPEMHYGDNFTSLTRYDLNNYYSFNCGNISNYGSLRGITPIQVFQPEDMLIVQDGLCSSTCAVFTELMKAQGHVKQLVFGGRAQTGPMQSVGGVKGANVYPYNALLSFISEAAYTDATPAQKADYLAKYGDLVQPFTQATERSIFAFASSPAVDGNVNVRNNIRMNDTSVMPLQFVYEAADCRLFYTAETIISPEKLWQAAYDAHFGNASCVAGSTNQPSSGLGVNNVPPPSARNFFGADVEGPYPLNSTTTSTAGTGVPPSSSGAKNLLVNRAGLCLAAVITIPMLLL